jgi:hypothetical protein
VSEERELTPVQAAKILKIALPLVMHRMDVGDLPYRYVGAGRRTTMQAVLALKVTLDEQQNTLKALAEDTEDLMRDFEL